MSEQEQKDTNFGFSQYELSHTQRIIRCFQNATMTGNVEEIISAMEAEYNRLEAEAYQRFMQMVNSQNHIVTATWRGVRVKRTPKVRVGNVVTKVTQAELNDLLEMEDE